MNGIFKCRLSCPDGRAGGGSASKKIKYEGGGFHGKKEQVVFQNPEPEVVRPTDWKESLWRKQNASKGHGHGKGKDIF